MPPTLETGTRSSSALLYQLLEAALIESEDHVLASGQRRPDHDLWVGQQELQRVSVVAHLSLKRPESGTASVDNCRRCKPATLRQVRQLCRRKRLFENVAVGVRNLALVKPSLGFATCVSGREAIEDWLAH